MSEVTGSARFDEFTVGELVPYAIKDGNNKEWGLGTVTASNQLARTTIIATLVSGTYDISSPSAITLSGSSADVICTNVVVQQAAPTEGDSATKRYFYGQRGVSFNTRTTAANRVYYSRIEVTAALEYTGLAMEVTTALAGNVNQGLYTIGADGEPDVKLGETGNVSTSTVGLKEGSFSAPIFLSPGYYFVANITSSAPGYRNYASSDYGLGGMGTSATTRIDQPSGSFFESGSGTTLPTTPAASLSIDGAFRAAQPLFI